jgi:hypothetical protein
MSSRKRPCSLRIPQGAYRLCMGWTPVIAYAVGYGQSGRCITQTPPRRTKPGRWSGVWTGRGSRCRFYGTVQGVDATNNIAERPHRLGVLWRKRSQGICSEQGNRWVERVRSLRHTRRIRGRPTFPMLVEAVSCLFTGERPELAHTARVPAGAL